MYNSVIYVLLVIAYLACRYGRQNTIYKEIKENFAFMQGFSLGALLIVATSNFLFTH